MGIVNTRNAVVGWGAIKLGKLVLREKAKRTLPGRTRMWRRMPVAAGALGAALAAGAWVLLRRGRGGEAEGQ